MWLYDPDSRDSTTDTGSDGYPCTDPDSYAYPGGNVYADTGNYPYPGSNVYTDPDSYPYSGSNLYADAGSHPRIDSDTCPGSHPGSCGIHRD